MISDNDLYTLAIFLGSLSMLLIVLYHFLEVNAIEDDATPSTSIDKAGMPSDKLPSKHEQNVESKRTGKISEGQR
ncbi:hypothetical protein MMC34_001741 [Xylographa carneopallida]|nr:hypothetical protein [Xylographa carneopallida]